jgi:Sortase and related acyltransferases
LDAASAANSTNNSETIDFLGQSKMRPARMDDAQGISSLYNFYVKSSTATFALEEETLEERRAWLLNHEAKNMPVLVLEMNGRVIGFGSVSPYHSRCGYSQTVELSIYVDPVCVSKGLGKLLWIRLFLIAPINITRCWLLFAAKTKQASNSSQAEDLNR